MRWNAVDDAELRRLMDLGKTLAAIAILMRRTRSAIKNRVHSLAIRRPRYWMSDEREYLKQHYGTVPAKQIAAALHRGLAGVYMQARNMGLSDSRKGWTPAADAALTQLNRQGVSDTEIARQLGFDRHHVTRRRQSWGLPDQSRGPQARAAVRKGVRRQLDRLGVPALNQLRVHSWRKQAAERGWPATICGRTVNRRHVQILDLLWDRGPQTKIQIAEAIGARVFPTSRKTLVSNDKGGSYLGALMRAGLVITLGRIVGGNGQGRNVHLYALDPSIEKGQSDHGQPNQA